MQEMDIVLQQTGLNTTQKFIARNPDIVRRVVKSMIEGIHFMRNNPAVAKRAIGKHMQIKDERDLEDSYQLLHSFIQPKPYPNLEGFKTDLRRSRQTSAGGQDRQREGFCRHAVHRGAGQVGVYRRAV